MSVQFAFWLAWCFLLIFLFLSLKNTADNINNVEKTTDYPILLRNN